MIRREELRDAGVSIWLDTLSRDLLDGGAFATQIGDHAVTGATSRRRRGFRPRPSAGGEFPASAPTGVMGDRPTPMDPDEAERRFADMLEEAGLPRFAFTFHDPAIDELQLTWEHGFTIHLDLTRPDESPIDDSERAAILGPAPGSKDHEPIHVYVPGSVDDPRDTPSIPGVVIHPGPPLHPDDVTTHLGIPVTSPSRTLIDLAEVMTAAELRAAFARAREVGLLDPEALRAARARVEWRPSLAMLDELIDEFCG